MKNQIDGVYDIVQIALNAVLTFGAFAGLICFILFMAGVKAIGGIPFLILEVALVGLKAIAYFVKRIIYIVLDIKWEKDNNITWRNDW